MSFYSLVSSLKDKSSQAMATLSADLKDFTAIIQEDVAEVATTVRKTVQERNEAAMKQRAEEEAAAVAAAAHESDTAADDRTRAASSASSAGGDDPALPEPLALASTKLNALFSSIGGYTLETSFGALNFGDVGAKLLHSADGLLGSLAGERADGDGGDSDGGDSDSDVLAARRFRLLALQEDADTYVEPPADAATFAKWQAATPRAELEALQAEVLTHYPAVVDKFAELVPSVVDADAFWAHYVYKAALLAAQEQRGADLLEHALNDSEEEVGWGDADSPRHDNESVGDDGEGGARQRPAAGSFFTEDESKEEALAPLPSPMRAPKPDSSSSDSESWIELDERKDPQAPLSTSSVASWVAPTATAAPAAGGGAVAAPDEDEELDWGDDDIVPEDVLSGDEASAAAAPAPALHEEPKKRAGDWGEWD
ncbi:hypothetical protein PybrP1_005133 [[Pythium] brassicae (nom. inval.)]|nr:hypothetical protein PybrP1_005133 [[Pythium] brassicae (nom. inval.)]